MSTRSTKSQNENIKKENDGKKKEELNGRISFSSEIETFKPDERATQGK